ncbi:hypothetical protein LCGC14_1761200 [marine sediment metagenome]|uniref:Uncharacterized protein n=1 Tax=marine sediment metagenome TaxID=412755 RepID=A0A0F9K0L5_9ZZZZ
MKKLINVLILISLCIGCKLKTELVSVKGWNEGVTICKNGWPLLIGRPKGTVYSEDDSAHYMINEGHETDEEFNKLRELANKVCNK